jgi:hypothetical protein
MFKRTQKTLVSLSIACFFSLGNHLAYAEVISSSTDLSGQWFLNEKLSDDMGKEVRRLVRREKNHYDPKGAGVTGARVIEQEHRQRTVHSTRSIAERLIPEFLLESIWLKISQKASLISIASGDESQRELYTDGRVEPIGLKALQSGRKSGDINVTGWDNEKLVVETTTDDGIRVIENYSVDTVDNLEKKLNVDYSLYHPKLEKPVKFRRVFQKTPVE